MNNEIKKRNYKISFTSEGIKNARLSFDISEGKITLKENENPITKGFQKETYKQGKNKERIQSSHEIPASKYAKIHEFYTFSKYDLVIATDTTPCNVEGQNISVACLFVFNATEEGKNLRLRHIQPLIFFEFWHDSEKIPENVVWKEICERTFFASNKKEAKPSVLVITDCDQRDHAEYNKGIKPIVSDYFLPDGFTLMFATEDTLTDLSNQIIRRCDRLSRRIADLLRKKELQLSEKVKKVDNPFYSHFRMFFDEKTKFEDLVISKDKLGWIPMPGSKLSLYGVNENQEPELLEEVLFTKMDLPEK